MAQVFCLGEALIDRLLPWGDDPGRDCLGGAPANGACALARLGTSAGFIGRLGRDPIGTAFAELFEQRGLDTSGLQWDEQRPSRVVCWWSVMPVVIAVLAALTATAGKTLPIRPWPPISCQLGWEVAGWLAAPFLWLLPPQRWHWSRPLAGIALAGAVWCWM